MEIPKNTDISRKLSRLVFGFFEIDFRTGSTLETSSVQINCFRCPTLRLFDGRASGSPWRRGDARERILPGLQREDGLLRLGHLRGVHGPALRRLRGGERGVAQGRHVREE